MPAHLTSEQCTFPEILRHRAETHPLRQAAIFLHDGGAVQELTYAELWRRSVCVARQLGPQTTAHGNGLSDSMGGSVVKDGPRALLLFPPGLDVLPAFVGCQLAGVVPVPTCYPKPHRAMPRLDAVARDCDPQFLLSDGQTLERLDPARLDPSVRRTRQLAVDTMFADSIGDAGETPQRATRDSIALLQYTSGSTSEPKGVVVRQSSLMANLESISRGFLLDADYGPSVQTAAFWLPFFHDMGLIGGILAPLSAGYRTVLMCPHAFVRQPIRWLRMISDYRASITGAPNFAYELCADRISPAQADLIDLGSLRLAFCGAEPIRARALQTFASRFGANGFRSDTFYPCYGLAESTLLASGGVGPSQPKMIEIDRELLKLKRVEIVPPRGKRKSDTLVSCGPPAPGMQLRIVDPQTRVALPECSIGEIWLRSDSVADGYWNRPEESVERFGAHLALPPKRWAGRWFGRSADHDVDSGGSRGGYLRTGDLGFLHEGQLYVTGRVKDLIVIRGRNYAPQDLELSVRALLSQGRLGAAAFAIEGPRGEALGMVGEVPRELPNDRLSQVAREVRRELIDEHEIDLRALWLVRPGSVPQTTSGKVRRTACRDAVLSGEMAVRFHWQRSGGAESPPLPLPSLPFRPSIEDRASIDAMVRDWLSLWLVSRAGMEPDEIAADKPLDDYGLDSLMAVELSGELADWSGIQLTPSTAWNHPTIAALANWVATELIGGSDAIDESELVASANRHP